MKVITDITELPELKTFEDDRKHEKLIIFDDFINLKPKEMKRLMNILRADVKQDSLYGLWHKIILLFQKL
jgi:hypothetical protein